MQNNWIKWYTFGKSFFGQLKSAANPLLISTSWQNLVNVELNKHSNPTKDIQNIFNTSILFQHKYIKNNNTFNNWFMIEQFFYRIYSILPTLWLFPDITEITRYWKMLLLILRFFNFFLFVWFIFINILISMTVVNGGGEGEPHPHGPLPRKYATVYGYRLVYSWYDMWLRLDVYILNTINKEHAFVVCVAGVLRPKYLISKQPGVLRTWHQQCINTFSGEIMMHWLQFSGQ